jgi:hypothetical protein
MCLFALSLEIYDYARRLYGDVVFQPSRRSSSLDGVSATQLLFDARFQNTR